LENSRSLQSGLYSRKISGIGGAAFYP
jgi:hypothetical protein